MPNTTAIKNDVMQIMVDGAIAEGSKPAVVKSADDVQLALNTKQLALIGDTVKEFMSAEELLFQGDSKKDEVARAISKLLKPDAKVEPTYEWWELVRTTWENVYMAKNKLANDKSANNAWLENTKRIKAKYGLEKPVKGSKDSSRMSEKRKAEKAELESKTDSVLREEYLAYKADDNLSKATAIKKEIERREKLNDKPLVEKRKARQALLASAMRKITDDALLEQIWALVPQSVKLEIAKSAK